MSCPKNGNPKQKCMVVKSPKYKSADATKVPRARANSEKLMLRRAKFSATTAEISNKKALVQTYIAVEIAMVLPRESLLLSTGSRHALKIYSSTSAVIKTAAEKKKIVKLERAISSTRR